MNRMRNKKKLFLIAPLALAGFALFIWVVMLLWNGVLTAAIGVKTITYLQAAGILLLCKILFGFGGGFGRGRAGRGMHAMQERFANMTPEEREKFKDEWKQKCNRWKGNAASSKSPPAGETSEV